jgi:YCII-related domain
VLATLVRLLGDIDQAEEALQEAFGAALTAWPRGRYPAKPAGLARVHRQVQGDRRDPPAGPGGRAGPSDGPGRPPGSGVIVSTGRLSPTTTRVRKQGDEVSVTDGPFIEGKELIPGFTIIRLDTKQEAIEWVVRYREMMGMPELRIAEISG